MWPIGTYERFMRKIKGQENYGDKVNFFGVLFCDVRQSKSKEYILNYLNVFQDRSGKYIDFYIPGYIPPDMSSEKNLSQENMIRIKNNNYVFDIDEYNKFCSKFEQDFSVVYPFSATLVIMEYNGGNFSSARKIVFELENTDKGIKSAGNFFLQIFQCAEKGSMAITIDQLSKKLSSKDKIKMAAVGANAILNFMGVDLEPVVNQCQEVYRYKVR